MSNESQEKSSPREPTDLERQFLQGYGGSSDDEFDDELLELMENRQRGSVLRPILMILVIVVVSSVIYDWRGEIEYFFADSDPVELGDATRFSSRAAENPDWKPPVEHNQYVSVEGMPVRVTGGGGYQFFRLVGAEIYVQREIEQSEDDDDDSSGIISQVPERPGQGVPVDEHRKRYEGAGRLVSFARAPERVKGLKEHYGEAYNMRFCEDLSPSQIEDRQAEQVETYRERQRRRYEEASEEVRAERDLRPEPTAEDVENFIRDNPVCVDAYLVHDGQEPKDQWWYVLVSALLGLFVIFTAFKLVRWFQAWLK